MQPLEIGFYSIVFILATVYTVFLLLLFSSSRIRPASEVSGQFFPSVTIVIPTFNESAVIERRLMNISQLDYPRDKMQVMVVDSASTDSTSDIVKRLANDSRGALDITLIEQSSRQGKANAVNEALQNTRSEIFVLTDADVTNAPDAVSRIVANFQNGSVGAASGIEVPESDASLSGSIETGYKAIYTAVRLAEAGLDTPFMCESEFSAYKRGALRPLKPGCMCDDIELTVGLRSTGLKGVYDPSVLFYEKEAGTINSKLSHKLRRGMANQHALLRTRSTLLSGKFGRYGRIVFPFEFFVHIISPILITLGLGLLLAMLLMSPVQGLYGIAISFLADLPGLVLVYLLTRKFDTARMMRLRGALDLVIGTAAFAFFQFALLVSLIQLGFKGPKLNWEKISDTRNASTSGTKNS